MIAGARAQVWINEGQPQPLKKLHQLPSLPEPFIGRDDELAELVKKLNSNHAAGDTNSAMHAFLQGMGGVGKTALATVLAHRLREG